MTLEPITPPNFHVFTDGGARGNPGPAATGFAVFQDNNLLHTASNYLGHTTNNVAEYQAVIHALEWFAAHLQGKPAAIHFKLDSNLVVNQLQGSYKIKTPHLLPLANRVHQLASDHHLHLTFSYIPRAQNTLADKLVNLALDASR